MNEYEQRTGSRNLGEIYFPHENGMTRIDLDHEDHDQLLLPALNTNSVKADSSKLVIIASEE